MTDLQEMVQVHYYNGQLLNADLFNVEQNYTSCLMAYHNQTLFSPGVASGLQVCSDGGLFFTISPGMAIDSEGRQLVWPEEMPPQMIPNGGSCEGTERQILGVYLQWNETPIFNGPQKGPYNTIGLLPAVVFNDSQGVKIADLVIVNGSISHVDNLARTHARLKVAASGGPPPPVQSRTLAGSTTFELGILPGQPTWKQVYYKKNHSQVFSSSPIVTATAVTHELTAYNLTLSTITTAGFQVGVSLLHPGGHGLEKPARVTINWMATPPGGCTVQSGDGS